MVNYQHHPRLRRAAALICAGEVVAYPTEAVWGLGCHPSNRHALERVLRLKRRDPAKGLILVAADMAQLDFLLCHLSADQISTLQATWPGPVTWLVPHRGAVSKLVCGRHDTVAVRVSAHPVVSALCRLVGGPIVSTSANPQGLVPARYSYRVRQYFADSVYYAPGQVGLQAKPSEIRDLESGRVVRAGI